MSLPGLVDTRHEYYRVFDIYVPIAIGVFGVIFLTALFLLVKNRFRAPERASRRHNNEPLEGTYAVLLVCVVAFLLYLTYSAEHQTDTVANRQRPAVVIDVTASKWEWTFTYRGYGFSTRSGTVGRQPLVVPAGVPVRFNLTSLDVIHSFWIPAIRYKHDAIPGSTQIITVSFGRGVFPGQCAEFCGVRHSDMVFTTYAISPSAFATWARGRGRRAVP